MRGGEKMHFYSILKKVWVAILLMLLVCFPGVSSVLYAEETPRVVRDMLYTITDPSKASSTEMLAFFEKEKKLGVGTQIAVNKKKLIAYSGNTMTILQNVGFPEASILKEREDCGFNSTDKSGTVSAVWSGTKYLSKNNVRDDFEQKRCNHRLFFVSESVVQKERSFP